MEIETLSFQMQINLLLSQFYAVTDVSIFIIKLYRHLQARNQ